MDRHDRNHTLPAGSILYDPWRLHGETQPRSFMHGVDANGVYTHCIFKTYVEKDASSLCLGWVPHRGRAVGGSGEQMYSTLYTCTSVKLLTISSANLTCIYKG